MNIFVEKLRSVISSLQSGQPRRKEEVASSFWVLFEEWTNTIPNSKEDLACIEKFKEVPASKEELLLAYHMLRNLRNGVSLKKVLLTELERGYVVSHEEWREAIEHSLRMPPLRR